MKGAQRKRATSKVSTGRFSEGDIIVKKMTLSSQAIACSAGAIIPVTTSVTSSLVQSAAAAEWSSFAARYQQYRVRKVRVRAFPTSRVNGLNSAGQDVSLSSLYVADYIGGSAPTTAAQVLSDEGAKVVSTGDNFVFQADWRRNPNAKLWNPTNAAIPTANQFGIAWASSTLTGFMPANATQFTYDVEWEVEFRGAQ